MLLRMVWEGVLLLIIVQFPAETTRTVISIEEDAVAVEPATKVGGNICFFRYETL